MRFGLRLIPSWRRLLVMAVPLLLGVGAALAAYVYTSGSTPPAAAVQAPLSHLNLNVPAPAGLLVHVIGAVAHPGLYRMRRGDRVYDAIASAGGLIDGADAARLPNLAGRLKDGEQVKVPFARGAPGSTVITRANLNTATVEELTVIPGFTENLAQDVIDYRTNFGGFQNTRELVTVLGMGEADYVIAHRYLTL